MGKCITLAMIVLAVLALVSCSVVWDEPQMYEVTSDIHALAIQINAADFSIAESDAFCMLSTQENENAKYFHEKIGYRRIGAFLPPEQDADEIMYLKELNK